MHKYYNDLANYFLLTDDIWLSDYFFGKCLSATSENLGSDDAMVIADSHCNLGLALERQSKHGFLLFPLLEQRATFCCLFSILLFNFVARDPTKNTLGKTSTN